MTTFRKVENLEITSVQKSFLKKLFLDINIVKRVHKILLEQNAYLDYVGQLRNHVIIMLSEGKYSTYDSEFLNENIPKLYNKFGGTIKL